MRSASPDLSGKHRFMANEMSRIMMAQAIASYRRQAMLHFCLDYNFILIQRTESEIMKTNIKELIKVAMASRNQTQTAVAQKAGWANQSSLSTAINRDNPSIETVIRILEALEYDLVIQDRHSTNMFVVKKNED